MSPVDLAIGFAAGVLASALFGALAKRLIPPGLAAGDALRREIRSVCFSRGGRRARADVVWGRVATAYVADAAAPGLGFWVWRRVSDGRRPSSELERELTDEAAAAWFVLQEGRRTAGASEGAA